MNGAEDSQALTQLVVGETGAVEVVMSAAEEEAVEGVETTEVSEEPES